MTRKHFLMLSSALSKAKERAAALVSGTASSPAAVLYGVMLAAEEIADALEKEVGRSFDKERFLKDAGAT
jgi:hypothetical protein